MKLLLLILSVILVGCGGSSSSTTINDKDLRELKNISEVFHAISCKNYGKDVLGIEYQQVLMAIRETTIYDKLHVEFQFIIGGNQRIVIDSRNKESNNFEIVDFDYEIDGKEVKVTVKIKDKERGFIDLFEIDFI